MVYDAPGPPADPPSAECIAKTRSSELFALTFITIAPIHTTENIFQSKLDYEPTSSLTFRRLLYLQLETCLINYTSRNPGPPVKKKPEKNDKKEKKKKKD